MRVLKYICFFIFILGLVSCKDEHVSHESQHVVKSGKDAETSSDSYVSNKLNHNRNDFSGDFCVYLILDSKNYKVLDNVIKGIANQQDTSSFKPHLTLFCGNNEDTPALKKQFESVFKNEKSFSIDIGKPKMGEKFSNKLYLPVEDNKTMEKDYLKAKKLDSSSEYAFDPHISVFYGERIPQSIIDIPKKYLYMLNKPKIQKITLVKDECSPSDHNCTRSIIESIELGT